MSGYLSSRAYTIYGGASEVQKDVIAKNVLGIKKSGVSEEEQNEFRLE